MRMLQNGIDLQLMECSNGEHILRWSRQCTPFSQMSKKRIPIFTWRYGERGQPQNRWVTLAQRGPAIAARWNKESCSASLLIPPEGRDKLSPLTKSF